MGKRWARQEIELLKSLYPQKRVKNLVEYFPDRNRETIVVKALSLGLLSAKLWQVEENKILKKYFANSTQEEILKLLPKRSWPAIMAQGERLGLKRKTDKPRLTVNEDYFQHWSSNMAYILGFILADGCIIKGTYPGYSDSLKFGVQIGDKDILEKIKKELKALHKISLVNNAAHFCISSQKLVNDLKRLSINYRKSLKEQITEVPATYVKDFIRGIIDGDGSISIDKKRYPNLSLCGGEGTVTYVRNHLYKHLRVYSKVSKRASSSIGDLYSIGYRCSPVLHILHYLYYNSELYLNRKYDLALKCLTLKIKERNKRI